MSATLNQNSIKLGQFRPNCDVHRRDPQCPQYVDSCRSIGRDELRFGSSPASRQSLKTRRFSARIRASKSLDFRKAGSQHRHALSRRYRRCLEQPQRRAFGFRQQDFIAQAFDDFSCHRKPKTDRRIERDRRLACHDETRMPDVAAAVRVIMHNGPSDTKRRDARLYQGDGRHRTETSLAIIAHSKRCPEQFS